MRRTTTGVMAVMILILALGAATPAAWAKKLSATAIRIEINDTDGDAGIQMFVDGEGWRRMKVFDPDGRKVLDIRGRSSVGLQGLTELFFESAEPSFDEQPLEELLALFPAGKYKFEGVSTEGVPLTGKAKLTHALPAAPLLVTPVDGDEEVDPDNTVVEWQLVADPPGSQIVGYEVIVIQEEPVHREFSANVGPGTTRINVPEQFMKSDADYKYEVLAIEKSGNQTLSEAEFATE